MSELEERRQRAREAGQDVACAHLIDSSCVTGIEEAIETATRVQITPELIVAARNVWPSVPAKGMRVLLRTAFEAAGFEVVE